MGWASFLVIATRNLCVCYSKRIHTALRQRFPQKIARVEAEREEFETMPREAKPSRAIIVSLIKNDKIDCLNRKRLWSIKNAR